MLSPENCHIHRKCSQWFVYTYKIFSDHVSPGFNVLKFHFNVNKICGKWWLENFTILSSTITGHFLNNSLKINWLELFCKYFNFSKAKVLSFPHMELIFISHSVFLSFWISLIVNNLICIWRKINSYVLYLNFCLMLNVFFRIIAIWLEGQWTYKCAKSIESV